MIKIVKMEGVIIKKIDPIYHDDRGVIIDILNESVNHIGLIKTKKGNVRAKHYHKKSVQYNYILSGKFEVILAKSDNLREFEKVLVNSGEMIIINPYIVHVFTALEDSDMIDIISLSREGTGYEDDVVRIDIKI